MGTIEGSRQRLGVAPAEALAGAAFGSLEVIRAKYKFSEDGGAAGTITLMPGSYVPDGFVIYGGWVDVIAAVTGSGASVAVQLQAANDLISAAAISGAPWSTTGRKAIVPVMTAASSLKATAARNISAVITAADLTAGEFDIVLIGVRTL